jgi:chaperonin GroES
MTEPILQQQQQDKFMIPLHSQILFKPYPSDEISTGGIIVPESARQVNNKGTIVKVGKGTKGSPMKLKEGQTAFRVKAWGTEVIIDGESHYLMDQDAILAVN